MVDKAGVEKIDTRGNGRVGGEDVVHARRFEGLVESQLLPLDKQADALDREKGRVPFVHVEDRRFIAERFQRAHAADAEDDLLPDARIVVAAVKLAGDGAVFGSRVQGRVRIEEEHLDAARRPWSRCGWRPGQRGVPHKPTSCLPSASLAGRIGSE